MVLTYPVDHVEGLVTSHTDAVASTNSVCSTQDVIESTDWDAQIRKDSFVEDPATEDVEINPSLSSVNLAVRNLVSSGIGLDISQNTKAILYVVYLPFHHYSLRLINSTAHLSILITCSLYFHYSGEQHLKQTS